MNEQISNQLIPCPDGTLADPEIGCVQTPAGIVNAHTDVSGLLVHLANGMMSMLIIGAGVSLIYGALHYITSRGNEDQTNKGKRILFWSVFGLLVGLLGKLILSSLLRFLG